MDVDCQLYTEHINIVRGQNTELSVFKLLGAHNNGVLYEQWDTKLCSA